MKITQLLAIALLLSVEARAQSLAQAPSDSRSTSISLSDERFSHLYFDTDDAGATWVRGRPYKARFDASGATLFPFMGSNAPQLYPLATALESAAVGGVPIVLSPAERAVRDGDRISIAHGAIDEVYELAVDTVEQTFVIRSLPASGELVLRVRLDTELPSSERDDGFVFANERGSVHYGRASVRSARSRTIDVETQLVEGGVEIRIPAAAIAEIGVPFEVDPVVAFFPVHQYQDQFAADLAFDAANSVYLVVEEEKFASVDDDVFSTRVSSNGTLAGTGYANLSTADWQAPHVANLNAYDQFLVVAKIKSPAVENNQWYIGGRHTAATAIAYGPTLQISDTGVFANMVSVDVGGDPYPSAPSYYCVVWEWDSATIPSAKQIVYRMVDNAAVVGTGGTALTTGSGDVTPCISNGNGGQTWTVAWLHEVTRAWDIDAYAARVNWNGSLTNTAFMVDQTSLYVSDVSVSSPFDTGEAVITYGFMNSSSYFTIGARVINGPAPGPLQDLGQFQMWAWDLFNPSADCEGQWLIVTHESRYYQAEGPIQLEAYSLSSGTLQIQSQAEFGASGYSRNPSVCAAHSTGGTRVHIMTVHDQNSTPSGPRSVFGCLYNTLLSVPIVSVCPGDGTGTACPCANNGSSDHGCANSVNAAGGVLTSPYGSGGAFTSIDTLQLWGNSLPNGGCLFFQGTDTQGSGAGIAFGDGKLCIGGTTIRLGVVIAANGHSAYPPAGGPAISLSGSVPASGGDRYYQIWYRDTGNFCTSDAYNLTNALRVTWLP